MARLPTGHLYRRGMTYWCRYRRNGKLKYLTLDTRDEDEAKRRMARQMTLIQAEIINGNAEEKQPEPPPTEEVQGRIQIERAWQRYLSSKTRPDTSDATLEQYSFQFKCFVKWVKTNHPNVEFLSDVTDQMAWKFLEYLEEKKNLSANTFNKYINILRLIFRVLNKEVGWKDNPWDGITKRKMKPSSRRAFTEDELKRIFEMADGEILTLCLLGFHTAFRLGDCCLLRWNEVVLDGRRITRTPLKTMRSSGKVVVVPIHEELYRHLKSLKRDGEEYVCPKTAEGYGNDRAGVTDRLQALFKKCGIKLYRDGTGTTGKDGKHIRAKVEVGFHSFRHTWVSMMAEKGVDSATIQAVVGWGSPAMSRLYTHISQAHLQDAISQGKCVISEEEKETEANDPAHNNDFDTLTASLGDEQLEALLHLVLAELKKREAKMPVPVG